MGKDKMRILIGNFIKIFDIKYINKFIHMLLYLRRYLLQFILHIFSEAHMYTHWSFLIFVPQKHIPW